MKMHLHESRSADTYGPFFGRKVLRHTLKLRVYTLRFLCENEDNLCHQLPW